ncbi:methyltransferase family protein [Halopolyspora algeriensis]|uniref:Methyltransferase family protein n=1 Tax=Halopolyspora algeriensis TaxID=1500506 RepID=A0A368VK82_9ACTN|nr:class I SAM-dependent methyltransferase [Halopolyspora algeriensis]RCW40697.1 methyltransferase family protein [Halopolyspora algeriensis]TQM53380.1 methyltransferase family protein [Halopolyspora algeriensis]
MGDYIFESDDTLTRTHLGALEDAFDAVSIRQLYDVGIRSGWKCLDAGAGSGSIARWLAGRVGSSGEVVATETDPRLLEGLHDDNVRVLEHDLTRDPLAEAEYDLVHARLLLILLSERERVLDRLIGALKPGGVLVLEDFDVAGAGALLAPEDGDAEVFDRVLETYLSAMAVLGADIRWGRHLYAALRRRGLRDVRSVGHAEVWPGGSSGCELIRTNFTQLRRQILDRGTVGHSEWRRAVELLDHEGFAMRSFLLVANSGLR